MQVIGERAPRPAKSQKETISKKRQMRRQFSLCELFRKFGDPGLPRVMAQF